MPTAATQQTDATRMSPTRTTALATLFVVATGSLWGLYWLPVRRLADAGLGGAWGTLGIVATAAVAMSPFALARWTRLRRADPVALTSIALGGVAFVLYSAGFLYGKVAVVILLFYLTPVWSTLLARYVMGWSTPWLRLAAIAVGIAGLVCVLSADGGLPRPRDLGDWLGLASGALWAVATTGIRARGEAGPGESAFVFALGGCLCAGVLAPLLEPLPRVPADRMLAAAAWTIGAGTLWWGVSMAGLIWAAARLEPARVGILLRAEVLLGTASAAIIAGESLGALELVGGALVLAAAVLEVWPVRGNAPAPPPTPRRTGD